MGGVLAALVIVWLCVLGLMALAQSHASRT
jgi:hypothetical protein